MTANPAVVWSRVPSASRNISWTVGMNRISEASPTIIRAMYASTVTRSIQRNGPASERICRRFCRPGQPGGMCAGTWYGWFAGYRSGVPWC